MVAVEIFAFAVGLGVLIVLIFASVSDGGTRRRHERDGGPIIPIGRLGDDKDDVGLG